MVHVTPFQGRPRIAACEVCSCYGTVFTKVDMKGSFAWHGSNERPDELPEPDEEWETLPRHGLAPGPRPRDPVESADWLVPGVCFSQLGGHPTWIQDAEYPECPDCRQTIPFVGQISNEDCQEFGEGIYYLFACGRCGVTATGYQQSPRSWRFGPPSVVTEEETPAGPGGGAMERTVTVRTELEAILVEQALAMARELGAASDAAPDGRVLEIAEEAAVRSGRELTLAALEAALRRQAEASEKKGRPAGSAPAAGRG
ncbi:hypothetical protein HK102_011608, partial [Quaeritorhiza haematococci]